MSLKQRKDALKTNQKAVSSWTFRTGNSRIGNSMKQYKSYKFRLKFMIKGWKIKLRKSSIKQDKNM